MTIWRYDYWYGDTCIGIAAYSRELSPEEIDKLDECHALSTHRELTVWGTIEEAMGTVTAAMIEDIAREQGKRRPR